MTKISVYIPCYNSENTIEACIDSLKNQSMKPNEIIVINDGSTDSTSEKVLNQNVKVVDHKKNMGIAQARNTALKVCKNNIIAGLDSDAVADKDWLKNLYETMKNEKASLVGGRVREIILNKADKWRHLHLKQDWGKDKRINPRFIAGNNFICVKKVIEEAGGYNSKYITNYEDVDLSSRLKKANYRIVYEPRAKVDHLCKDNIKSVLERHWRHMFWDYPIPVNLYNKLKKVIINLYTAIKFLIIDLFRVHEVSSISLYLFFHHTAKDLFFKKS